MPAETTEYRPNDAERLLIDGTQAEIDELTAQLKGVLKAIQPRQQAGGQLDLGRRKVHQAGLIPCPRAVAGSRRRSARRRPLLENKKPRRGLPGRGLSGSVGKRFTRAAAS